MEGLTAQDQFLASIRPETVQGEDAFAGATPNANEFYLFRELNINEVYEAVEHDVATGSIAGECHNVVYKHNEYDFILPIVGQPGVDLVPPGVDQVLRASNFIRTINPGVEVVYHPIMTNDMVDTPTATLLKYVRSLTNESEAKRLMARGGRHNVDLQFEVGVPSIITGSGRGNYTEEPAAFGAMPTLPTQYSLDVKPFTPSKLTLTVDSGGGPVEYFISKINIATAWAILDSMGGDPVPGQPGALRCVTLTLPKTGARFGGSMSLEGAIANVSDALTVARSGGTAELSLTLQQGTNIMEITGTIQFGVYTKARPKYDFPFFFVRPVGEDGETDGPFQIRFRQAP